MGIYVGGTDSAHHLDDYEEGTWTPGLIAGAASITVSTATYTKVGRAVTVQLRYTSTTTPNSSALQISGLPFTSAANTHQTSAIMHNGWDYTGSEEPYPVVYHAGDRSHFNFYYSRTNGNGWTPVTGTQTGGQGAIMSWTYPAA